MDFIFGGDRALVMVFVDELCVEENPGDQGGGEGVGLGTRCSERSA